jgi:hypothetical protein
VTGKFFDALCFWLVTSPDHRKPAPEVPQMSLSNAKREINMPEALRLMMHDLDQPFDWQEHDSTEGKFVCIHRTTWDELINRGSVRATTFDRYILMPLGWIEGLKVTGAFDDPEFKAKAGLLSSALKARVKGRHEPELADGNDIADETGLDEYFVYNTIDSHLLRELFNQIDAYWAPDDRMKNMIEIPTRFGLPILG